MVDKRESYNEKKTLVTDSYAYWLDTVKGIMKKKKERLIEELGSPKEVFYASKKEIASILGKDKEEQLKRFLEQREGRDIHAMAEELSKKGISFVGVFEEGFPQRLLDIPDRPFGLYYKGRLPKEEILTVAIVGARECSEYGKYVARELGRVLGERGIQVISGMARGVDGISQHAALQAGGESYGVLGCGVDICYPLENKELYEKLILEGGVLSTYEPGTAPIRSLFPPRNRIVSGLSDALVVVEARQRSGTLITVDQALEQGKEVYAVPGRVIDRLSDGCNQLIRDGANVFLTPEEFLRTLSEVFPKKCRRVAMGHHEKSEKGQIRELTEREETVLSVLDISPQSIEDIREILLNTIGTKTKNSNLKQQDKVDVSKHLSEDLMKLCMRGYALQVSPGWFRRASDL